LVSVTRWKLQAFPTEKRKKSDFPMPRFNVARIFQRQTLGLGGEQETIEDGPNRLGGKQDISRITVTAGKFAVTDIFDVNAFAGDPRTTFLNWNIYGGGSYDWTMHKFSYTWGAFTVAGVGVRHDNDLRLALRFATCCTSIKYRSVARTSAANHLR
jgi:hypothetical protein